MNQTLHLLGWEKAHDTPFRCKHARPPAACNFLISLPILSFVVYYPPHMRGPFLLVLLVLLAFAVWLIRRPRQARKFVQSRSTQVSISPTPLPQQQKHPRRWPQIFFPLGFIVFIVIVLTRRGLRSAVFGFAALLVLWSFAFMMKG